MVLNRELKFYALWTTDGELNVVLWTVQKPVLYTVILDERIF